MIAETTSQDLLFISQSFLKSKKGGPVYSVIYFTPPPHILRFFSRRVTVPAAAGSVDEPALIESI